MNTSRQILAALIISASHMTSAAAAEGLAQRLASGLGTAIAAQGNLAFQKIRGDLQQNLADSIDNWLPRAAPLGHSGAAGTSAGLQEYVELHQHARRSAAEAGALQ